MEDILASIRRILSEDESKAAPVLGAAATAPQAAGPQDVLALDASMLVEEPAPARQEPEPMMPPAPPAAAEPPPLVAAAQAAPAEAKHVEATPLDRIADEMVTPTVMTPPAPLPAIAPPPVPAPRNQESLVAPEAAAAAASSVGALLKHLQAERQAAVYRGGPTIEDVVREEMRPLLKSWLDAHLPPLVERLVRAEIERVVARSVS